MTWAAGPDAPGGSVTPAAPSKSQLCPAWSSAIAEVTGEPRAGAPASRFAKAPCRYCYPQGFLPTLALDSNGNLKFYYVFHKHRSQSPVVQAHHYHLTDGVAEA